MSGRSIPNRSHSARLVEDHMTNRSIAGADRKVPLTTAVSLLAVAILAAFAQFGVLKTLIVPADAVATTNNIAASSALFWGAIVAFLIVTLLDVVVAVGFYAILQPVNKRLARLVAAMRIGYAMIFAFALLNLVDAARLANSAAGSAPLQAQVAASVASFDTVWHIALGVFGLHLIGLGALLFRFEAPRVLAALVVVAGAGYLADSLGTIFIAGYGLTISTVTFVGEALLIVWLFRRALSRSRSSASSVAATARTTPAAS
jgi:Domain of unknown function (DUF4386)